MTNRRNKTFGQRESVIKKTYSGISIGIRGSDLLQNCSKKSLNILIFNYFDNRSGKVLFIKDSRHI